MSYNLVDSTTGALTRVAGRGKAEYGASSVRSGTYIPSSPVQAQKDLSFSVTFSEPMPDNDYQVIFGSSSNNAASGTIQCVVRSRSTTGFTGIIRNVGQDEVSVASGTFTWFAFKLYSDVEYSNIVNSMPSDASASNKLATMDKVPESVANPTELDTNKFLKSGYYSLGDATKRTNLPIQKVGTLLVYYAGYYVIQEYILNENLRRFMRRSVDKGANWSAWTELATMDNVAREVDTSYMSNGVLNILAIRQALGAGCYEIMGQGNSGHGSIRLNIWQVSSGAFVFSCCITDFSGVRSICNNDGNSPTVDVSTSYFETTNKIIKIF